jgi:hypothetical protein
VQLDKQLTRTGGKLPKSRFRVAASSIARADVLFWAVAHCNIASSVTLSMKSSISQAEAHSPAASQPARTLPHAWHFCLHNTRTLPRGGVKKHACQHLACARAPPCSASWPESGRSSRTMRPVCFWRLSSQARRPCVRALPFALAATGVVAARKYSTCAEPARAPCHHALAAPVHQKGGANIFSGAGAPDAQQHPAIAQRDAGLSQHAPRITHVMHSPLHLQCSLR